MTLQNQVNSPMKSPMKSQTNDMNGENGTTGTTDMNGADKKPRNAIARKNRHRQIMVMLLKGSTVKDIALELGYAPASISILIRTAGFQLELAKLRDIVLVHVEDELSKMGRLTPLAHGFYEQVLRDNNNVYSSDLKFKISKDLLDRLGIKVAEGEKRNPGEVGDVAHMVQAAFDEAKVIEVKDVEVVGEVDSANEDGFEREGKQVSGEQITKELQELLAEAERGDDEGGEEHEGEHEGESEDKILQEVAQV